jgi:hypothetical protein
MRDLTRVTVAAVLFALSACKVLPTVGATTVQADRSAGTVLVAWQAQPFKGLQDYQTPMLAAARTSCAAWDYPDAVPMGFANVTNGVGIHGVTPYTVTQRFQCAVRPPTGGAPMARQ